MARTAREARSCRLASAARRACHLNPMTVGRQPWLGWNGCCMDMFRLPRHRICANSKEPLARSTLAGPARRRSDVACYTWAAPKICMYFFVENGKSLMRAFAHG